MLHMHDDAIIVTMVEIQEKCWIGRIDTEQSQSSGLKTFASSSIYAMFIRTFEGVECTLKYKKRQFLRLFRASKVNFRKLSLEETSPSNENECVVSTEQQAVGANKFLFGR